MKKTKEQYIAEIMEVVEKMSNVQKDMLINFLSSVIDASTKYAKEKCRCGKCKCSDCDNLEN